ncbi:MAG: FKBP-type peptidyl-prolyl cis-trans isomerase [Prevotella sp.]|nr:FKBP-type peptidyl-prolyl cis-trans isomerase [Prevotella sp.]
MKKITFMALAAITAATFTSCGNQTPNASLKNDIDTLSYAFGLGQSQGIEDYFNYQGIDSAYIGAFIKGLNDGAAAGDNKKKDAYYAGVQIGQQIARQWVKGLNGEVFGQDSTQTVSLKNILAGFANGATKNYKYMDQETAQQIFQQKMADIKKVYVEKEYGPNKEAGEKFLAENAKKDGVQTLESGVQYKVITEGKGAIPTDTSMVKVNYEGKLIDGTVFDSSYQRGTPATMKANEVIKGWTEALVRMPVGSKWEVYIPQEMGYQDRNMGNIKPFSALVFTIELLGIEDPKKP